jgi:hypothetical protein
VFSILEAIGLFIVAIWFAFLDTQVERKKDKKDYGWAKYLDCWRPKNPNSLIPRIYSFVMEGRELTGYHIAFFGGVFIFLHYPFLKGFPWNLGEEFYTLSVFLLIMMFEDFLYFVLNPDFGVKRFKHQFIPWHPRWFGPVPTGILIGIAVSIIFAIIAMFTGKINALERWGIALGIFLWLTIIAVFLSEIIRGRAKA